MQRDHAFMEYKINTILVSELKATVSNMLSWECNPRFISTTEIENVCKYELLKFKMAVTQKVKATALTFII